MAFLVAMAVATGPVFECGFENGTCGAILENRWRLTNRFTPSGSTGPSSGRNGDADVYAYLEASDGINATHAPSLLTFPSFEPIANGTVLFSYHMYGEHIGTLTVLASSDGVLEPVWSISGQQHASGSSAWTAAAVPLPGNTSAVVLQATCGGGLDNTTCGDYDCQRTCSAMDRVSCPCGGWYGDIAVDAVAVYDGDVPTFAPTAVISTTPPPTGPCCEAVEIVSDAPGISGLYVATTAVPQPNYTTSTHCLTNTKTGFWGVAANCSLEPTVYHPSRSFCPESSHGWQRRIGGIDQPVTMAAACFTTASPTVSPTSTAPTAPTTAAPTEYVPPACREHLSVNCSGPHNSVQDCRTCARVNNPGAAVCRFRHRNAYCDNPSTRAPTPSPTAFPTVLPTAFPTVLPTAEPTPSPMTALRVSANSDDDDDYGFVLLVVAPVCVVVVIAAVVLHKRSKTPETPRAVHNPVYFRN